MASFPEVAIRGANQISRKFREHSTVPTIRVGRKCPCFVVGSRSMRNPMKGSFSASITRAIKNRVAQAAGFRPITLV